MISVIAPVLNEEKNIERCLKSLIDQSLDRAMYEIVIVDGHSKDRSVEIASDYADKIVYQKSEGIGGARRDGVDASVGDILAFTDADTVHDPNWLEIINDNMRSHGTSTGPILFYDGNFKSDLLRLWRKSYQLFHLVNFYWLIGSNMAIRKDVYNKIGGHKNISILEDFDISVQVFKEGDVHSKYDKYQKVYTSARRIDKLLTYFLIYANGHYNYLLTKNYNSLLNYPRFDEVDLKTILKISDKIDISKINSLYHSLRSAIEKRAD